MDNYKSEIDLHIQYKNETGYWFQYAESVKYTGTFHSLEGYSREYAKWIEEKYIKLLNKNTEPHKEIQDYLEE